MLSKLLCRQGIRDLCLALGLLGMMATLLLFPTQAISACKEGLHLCFNVIIPSLFPFFVLSSLTVELGFSLWLGRLFSPIMRPLFRVPGEGELSYGLTDFHKLANRMEDCAYISCNLATEISLPAHCELIS